MPDSVFLSFTVNGSFSYYHVQLGPNGQPSGPNNYHYDQNNSMVLGTMVIRRSDSNWSLIDSNQILQYSFNGDYQYNLNETWIERTLDTQHHLISNLNYHTKYGVVQSQEITSSISVTGIAYSRKALTVLDSDVTKNLLSESYSEYGGRYDNCGGVDLGHIDKVNVSGSLNYNLLDVPIVAQKTD